MPIKLPLRTRFYQKTTRDPNGCLVWTGSTLGGGYGCFSIRGKTLYAHRVAWEMEREAPPDGRQWTLDHLCRNRLCVDVEHLELVPFQENVIRGIGPTAENDAKTHCIAGHELTGANLIVRPGARRACRECGRRRSREYLQRRRAASRPSPG